jgi:hypothetical protein
VEGCIHTAITCDDSNECTDDTCNSESGCVYTPDDTNTCDDGDPCTVDALGSCENGLCVGGGPACDDGDECTQDSCDPATGECSYDFVCAGICRTAGFWGNRFTLTDAVIHAAGGCLEVCGQSICGTDDVDLQNTLGSALEALCTPMKDTAVGQTYRQMVTAALNCIVSGYGANCAALLDPVLEGTVHGFDVSWLSCNAQCELGSGGDAGLLGQCRQQLDCWNNGNQWVDVDPGVGVTMACATGRCEDAPYDYCRGTACGIDNPCVPFEFSCHTESLCETPVEDLFAEQCVGGVEKLGPASPAECKLALGSKCVYGKAGSCLEPNPCLDDVACNP